MNTFRRNSALELSNLIKPSDLKLHSSPSNENLRKMDFACNTIVTKPYFLIQPAKIKKVADHESKNEFHGIISDVTDSSILESLSVSKNPFDKFVKEEFRFQNESVRRLSLEITKDFCFKRKSCQCMNKISETNSNLVINTNNSTASSQISENDVKTITDKNNNNIITLSNSDTQVSEKKSYLNTTPQLSKRERNIFAPVTF